MKKLLPPYNLKFIFLVIVAPFYGVSFAQTEVKVILTGYSDDVIADSVLNTLATAVTTAPVDLAPGNVFAVDGYSNTTSLDPLEVGLPTNGQFTSSAGHNFQLADYASNNSLRLLATQSGSLAFDVTDRLAYDSLFILAAGGSGGGDLNYTVHFSDASIKSGLISVDDWFCNACATYAITGLSEVDRATGSKIGINEYTIKEYPVFFTGGDENKQIVSIDFSVPSGAPGTCNIFGITAYMQGSLPVTLQYFNVTPVNGKALLQWKTSQEFNSNTFIIERASASNPSNFINIGAVNATSSATGSQYSFINDGVVSGTYLYRLLQKDIDGNVKILGTKSITLNTKIKWLIQDMGTQWQLISPSAFIYRLLDMNGRLLQTASGTGSATMTKPLAHGIYEIQVQADGEFSTQKLIK